MLRNCVCAVALRQPAFMSAPAEFLISRPLLVFTDYQSTTAFSTAVALSAQSGVLATTLASGTASAVRGASMSLPNLIQLLDTLPGTAQPNLSTGRAPFFSLPLELTPHFGSVVRGTLELGATIGVLLDNVSGTIPVVIQTDSENITRIRVDGAQAKIKSGVRIDLVDGLEIGATRTDDAGRAWLDLRFLTLFSYVTEGANLLTIALQGSEKAGRFFLRFNGLPLALNDAPVLELNANVVLDFAPNFAPRLDLSGGASGRSYSAQAGKAFNFGADFFFGGDFAAGSLSGLDLVDPIGNLSSNTSGPSSVTALQDWRQSVPKPVLMSMPTVGDIRLASGEVVSFPPLESVAVSLDSIAASTDPASSTAAFVRLGGQVYRALGFDELAGLQLVAGGSEALGQPAARVSFVARDSLGALSPEFVAKFQIQIASVSGAVVHAVSGSPIPGVEVLLARAGGSGGSERGALSGEGGQWRIDGLDFDRFTASARHVAAPADLDQALGAGDVLAALKLATGRGAAKTAGSASAGPPASAADQIARLAADIDRDGAVEISDAAGILSWAAGLERPAQDNVWRFILQGVNTPPASDGYGFEVDVGTGPPLNWLGYLLGDVDGSVGL